MTAKKAKAKSRRETPSPEAENPNKKGEILQLRILADQKAALVEAAARDGQSLSAWARRTLLQAAGVLPPVGGQPAKTPPAR